MVPLMFTEYISTYHPYLFPLSHSSKLPESLAPLILVVLFGPHSST